MDVRQVVLEDKLGAVTLIAGNGVISMLDDSGLQTPVGKPHEGAVKGFGGPLFKLTFHIRVITEAADIVDEVQNHEDFVVMA